MPIERLEQVKDELDQVSPSFCLAKWYQVTLHLFNGNTQSCHHVKSHRVPLKEIAKSPASLHNSCRKMATRAKMLDGKFPSECQYCWKIEKVGEYSDRIHKSAEDWARRQMPSVQTEGQVDVGPTVKPTYLEVAFSNFCNFKCLYCSPTYSTLWQKEILKHGAYPTSRRYGNLLFSQLNKTAPLDEQTRAQYVRAFWSWWPEVSPQLQHLRVTGGEPFLAAETWLLMDELIRGPRPGLVLSINSNMSFTPQLLARLLEKLSGLQGKVAKVVLHCSIDSTGLQAEYIRSGLRESLFYDNIVRLLTESAMPLHISFMITVNALSLPGLKPLLARILELRRDFPAHQIGFDTPYLKNPLHLSVLILPSSFQKYLVQTLEFMNSVAGFSLEEIQRVERILSLMRSRHWVRVLNPIWRCDLMIVLRESDRRRGTDHEKTFPEYREFFKSTRRLLVLDRSRLR